MSTVNVGMEIINGTPPKICISIETGNLNPVHITLTPSEARAFGLQCKVLADSVERMMEITQ